MDRTTIEVVENAWRPLYRAGAAAAIVVLALVPLQMAVFLAWPLPNTVPEWFALFQQNRLIGLLDMDLLMVVDNVLLAIMFLALYVALRNQSPSLMAVAITLELVGVTTYFASNTAFEMLALSDQYAVATTDTQRSIVLAAGQAMIATWQGSAFNISYVLGAVAILLFAFMMLRTQVFGRPTAYTGALFGALSLVPASAGRLGLVFSLLSLVPMWIWLILIARRLSSLARGAARDQPQQSRRVDATARLAGTSP